jgi:hypothetical protein
MRDISNTMALNTVAEQELLDLALAATGGKSKFNQRYYIFLEAELAKDPPNWQDIITKTLTVALHVPYIPPSDKPEPL